MFMDREKERLLHMRTSEPQVAIPLGIDETLLVDASKAEALQGVVAQHLHSQLQLDLKSDASREMVYVVSQALSALLKEDSLLSGEFDQLGNSAKQPLH